jgi:phosphatidylinositol-3,4,5-trisphosphate 3-phosphatase/dual-specificity protein phosphatase PTEN
MSILIQQKVSGKRRRYQDKDFNLDLSFITDRVIGMSYPAHTWKEKIYRNDIELVAKFFDNRYPGCYKIYNMSNRPILECKFKGEIESYSWADHHSPALSVLFLSCDSMFKYLMQNRKNVVSVNCNAGKGRTGTSISCFLIYSGLAENYKNAITYYGWKRFITGRGVS